MTYPEYLKSDSWKNRVKKRMEIDHYSCQMCGSQGTMSNPLECHHLNYHHIGREDIYKDLVIVCHCCHTQIHHLMSRIVSPQGQQGFSNKAIPPVSVLTLSGTEIIVRKETQDKCKEKESTNYQNKHFG